MKIGIVSCFNEGEANSEYTKVIYEEFIRQGHDVEILRLPFSVFGNNSPSMRKRADAIIGEIGKKIPHFDYISIQYEFLLYGYNFSDVQRRVLYLLQQCNEKNFSVTFHRIDLNKKIKKRKWYKQLFNNKVLPTADEITLSILDEINRKQGLAIVHTLRDKEKILAFNPQLKVFAHPLNYKRQEDVAKLKKSFSKKQYMEEKGIRLSASDKIIGVIGSFVRVKDYTTVTKALNYLPENYHLFIFGGQHKLEISMEPKGSSYIQEILSLVSSLKLNKRVHFMGFQQSSEDMLNAYLFCDYVVLPYIECGEMASAAAGNALELNSNVFASRNHCFEEWKKFTGEAFYSFDMGNYMELAEKIQSMPDKKNINQQRVAYLEQYSISKNIQHYLDLLD